MLFLQAYLKNAIVFHGKDVYYAPSGGNNPYVLHIGDGKATVSNDQIVYLPGSEAPFNPGSAMFLFNVSHVAGSGCTLLHQEDDYPITDVAVAMDSGNNYNKIWNATVKTFIYQRIGVPTGAPGRPDYWTNYILYCPVTE